jgi:hypothetical protein
MKWERQKDKLLLEDAKIIFRNFGGNPTQFNTEGKRDFCVLLDEELANELKSEGWNIRYSKQRDQDETPQAYMNVAVSYANYAPTITLITKHNKTVLHEQDLGVLDFAEIDKIDLIIRPYSWQVNGNEGIKAYLKSAYITIEEDEFSDKYRDIPSGDPIPTPKPVEVEEAF